MNTEARQKLTNALTSLLLDEAFYGTLAMRLELIEDVSIPTEATNGKFIKYNPDFINGLSHEQVKNELRHEVEHCARQHPYRRDNRDPETWNVACDYSINNDMIAEGAKLDDTWLTNPSFRGMSEEQIYGKVGQQPKKQQQQQGQQSGGHGTVEDAQADPKAGGVEEQKQNWQSAVLQAAQQAKGQGKLPAWAQELVEQIKHPAVDWRAALRKFVEQTAKHDFTWSRPSTRYLAHGLYLPSMHSEQLPPIVVYWDTSGSRWSPEARQLAANEIAAIIGEAKPKQTYVIYADSKVKKVDCFEPGDPVKFKPIGGGGTAFEPVFEYVETEGIEPCCFIGITDLDGSFPQTAPSYPVLWVTEERGATAPFGEVLEVRV